MKSHPYLAVLLIPTDRLDSNALAGVAVIEFTRRLRARQTAFFGLSEVGEVATGPDQRSQVAREPPGRERSRPWYFRSIVTQVSLAFVFQTPR